MNTQKIIISLLILVFSINVISQSSLSLSEAISLGLKNNYDLQISRSNEEISKINNNWGNTGIMPSINFTLNGRENLNYNDNEDYRTQTISPDLSLNWLLFDGFSARINKKKYEELELQSQGNTIILVESTIQDIILAYNNCILQKEISEVYKDLAVLSEDRYSRATKSEKIGTSTTYDVLQAKTSWLEDQSNFMQQILAYENAVRSLNYILAVADDTEWELTSKLEANFADFNLNDLKAKLTTNNQTLRNQYIYQSLLAKETSLAKSSYSPTISLNTGFSTTGLDNFYSDNTPNISQNTADAYVGLTLSFNIFNGGIKKRSLQIAKINEESAQIQTTQMKHSLNNQLLQMYSSYQIQKEIVELSDEKLAATELNLKLSEAKLKNGSINSFNYRDIQNIYLNAAISKYSAINNLIQTNTDLLRISGGIISEYR